MVGPSAMPFAAEVTGCRLIEEWQSVRGDATRGGGCWTSHAHVVESLRNLHVAVEAFGETERPTAPMEEAVASGTCVWMDEEQVQRVWRPPAALQFGAALLAPVAASGACWVLWFRAAPPTPQAREALAAWTHAYLQQCAKGQASKAVWAAEEEEEAEETAVVGLRSSLSMLLPTSPTATTWSLYRRKWRGRRAPPRAASGGGVRAWLVHNNLLYGARVVSWMEIFWTFVGSFVSIAVLAAIHYGALLEEEMVLVIGSFGATAVLLYAAQESPLASPRNCLGGHFLSAVWGVTCWKMHEAFLPEWCAAALSVAGAITIMQGTATTHPPGGATALIAVIGGEVVHELGYLYVLVPVVGGAAWMLLWAMVVNNMPSSRRYPVLVW